MKHYASIPLYTTVCYHGIVAVFPKPLNCSRSCCGNKVVLCCKGYDHVCDSYVKDRMAEVDHLFSHFRYIIEESPLSSESAWIYFVRHEATDGQFVVKILRRYEDERYSQRTLKQRRDHQIEALRWNPIFTSGIYIGLAPVLQRTSRHIALGEIASQVEEVPDVSAPRKSYALLMKRLPHERRLDMLLKQQVYLDDKGAGEDMAAIAAMDSGTEALLPVMELLARRIAAMHMELPPLDDGARWGGFARVQEKLRHNIVLFEHKDVQHHLASSLYEELRDILYRLVAIVEGDMYRSYFEERVSREKIKRCHGDLKCANIWVMPYENVALEEQLQCVKVLDAVDFKGMYCNIDPLSDIAMLAVNIFAVTQNHRLLDALIKSYLALAEGQDEVVRAVLTYYLFEKAVVCASVCMMSGGTPEEGKLFLKLAKFLLTSYYPLGEVQRSMMQSVCSDRIES
jgi:aminoglycoside phosphotransferase family enzyme